MENDDLYNICESVTVTAASVSLPVAAAGTATVKGFARSAFEYGVSGLAGQGSSYLAYKATGDKNIANIANIVGSTVVGSKLAGENTKRKINIVKNKFKGNIKGRFWRRVGKSGSKTPSEIARSWQGTGKYPGIDEYVDITIDKGTILYRGEPNGTEYFTTLDAIEQSSRDATKLFEGLQVEKNPIHGYRGEMQGYIFNENVASAYGITKANPQFGKDGLPQYYVPDVQNLIEKGVLTSVDNIKLIK